MRLATFNLESLDPVSRDGVTLAERAEILRPQLERLAADVLCLQEVNGQPGQAGAPRELSALRQLLDGTRYAGYELTSSHGHKSGTIADVHNLVVVTRFPVLGTRQVRNDHVPAVQWQHLHAAPAASAPAPVEFDRPILAVTLDLGSGQHLHVINVHLRAPLAAPVPGQKDGAFAWRSVRGWAEGYFLSALKRSGQALELRLLVEDLLDAAPHGDIAICGDFNAEDHETPLKIVVAGEEDTGSGRLSTRSMAILDRNIPADRRFSVLHHGRKQMLDHIVVSRTLLSRFRTIEVHNETLTDELVSYTRVQHPTGSHHAPLVATFDVPST
ncbi:MAG: hypothetical protein RLZ98_219 [Pseudomonadota bacterium]|jgi:endonuclease/exonuclease/phosphatase family metal-dependent hydrolase